MTWAKENYDLISLFVGVVGVIIAVISLYYEIQKKKQKKAALRFEIKKKEEPKEVNAKLETIVAEGNELNKKIDTIIKELGE